MTRTGNGREVHSGPGGSKERRASARHTRLVDQGGDPRHWEFEYVWENESDPPGYAVVLRSDGASRVFTVMPIVGRTIAYDVLEVTDI